MVRERNQNAKSVCVSIFANPHFGVIPIAVDYDFNVNMNLYISELPFE